MYQSSNGLFQISGSPVTSLRPSFLQALEALDDGRYSPQTDMPDENPSRSSDAVGSSPTLLQRPTDPLPPTTGVVPVQADVPAPMVPAPAPDQQAPPAGQQADEAPPINPDEPAVPAPREPAPEGNVPAPARPAPRPRTKKTNISWERQPDMDQIPEDVVEEFWKGSSRSVNAFAIKMFSRLFTEEEKLDETVNTAGRPRTSKFKIDLPCERNRHHEDNRIKFILRNCQLKKDWAPSVVQDRFKEVLVSVDSHKRSLVRKRKEAAE